MHLPMINTNIDHITVQKAHIKNIYKHVAATISILTAGKIRNSSKRVSYKNG